MRGKTRWGHERGGATAQGGKQNKRVVAILPRAAFLHRPKRKGDWKKTLPLESLWHKIRKQKDIDAAVPGKRLSILHTSLWHQEEEGHRGRRVPCFSFPLHASLSFSVSSPVPSRFPLLSSPLLMPPSPVPST